MDKIFKKIVCYGEILWDILPNGLNPAGATLNVAYHLKKMGIQSYIISRVGHDILGEELLKILKKWGIDYTFCIVDNNFPTGKVIAKIDTLLQEVSYEIIEPVAWDFIVVEKEHSKIIKNTDGLVFQSLSARNEISRKTLYTLLEYSSYKIFDVNLRPPFYSEHIIKELLEKSDLVKMSISELSEIISWLKSGTLSEEEAVCFLKECFNLKEILITKGNHGASYYGIDDLCEKYVIPINIKNTIGSGDAFFAGFLAKKINGDSSEEAMDQAITLGALVASKEGSCPNYDSKEFAQPLSVKHIKAYI